MDREEHSNGTGDLKEEAEPEVEEEANELEIEEEEEEETQDQEAPQEDRAERWFEMVWRVTLGIFFATFVWLYRCIILAPLIWVYRRLILAPLIWVYRLIVPVPHWSTDNTLGGQHIPTSVPEFWPESDTLDHRPGHSYEVTTDSHVYRISTCPTDFIGTTSEDWPEELKVGYNRYKAPEVVMDEAVGDYFNEKSNVPPDEQRLCLLQREIYILAKDAAEGRIAFLRRWPNAFERHRSTDSHWHWPKELINRANDAQILEAYHGSRQVHHSIQTQPPKDSQPLPLVLFEDVIGLQVSAIGPRWYRTARNREVAQKKRDRAEVLDFQKWDVTLASRPSLSRPSLPALRKALSPSLISDISFAVREWVKDVLDMCGLLGDDFRDPRWLKYI